MRAVVIRWRNQKQLESFKNEYCYYVMGTNNLDQSSEQILEIHAGRMRSENYNKELKEGYNIEWMPSNDFTKNTNYFNLGIITFNCVEFVKRFFFGKEVVSYKIKKFRHWFIKICCNLIKTGRRYVFQVINAIGHTFFINIRGRIQYSCKRE